MVREVSSLGNALDISASPLILRKGGKEPEKDLDKVVHFLVSFDVAFAVYMVYSNSFTVLANIHKESPTRVICLSLSMLCSKT